MTRELLVTRYWLLVFHPSPRLRVIDHPAASRHPSAEGNFIPQRYDLSSPPLEGWAKPGVVRECVISRLFPFVIASGAWRSSK